MSCAPLWRAGWIWLSSAAIVAPAAQAQTLTSELFNPQLGAFVPEREMPFRRIGNAATFQDSSSSPGALDSQESLASEPSSNGDDSAPGAANRSRPPSKSQPKPLKPNPGVSTGRFAPGQPDTATGQRTPVPPSQTANRPPVAAALRGTVPGQPQRRPLGADTEPFGPIGDYAGPFLIRSAVELSGGYDTNPGWLARPRGLPLWVVAPEFLAVSNWERHALVADLRGSFTGYGGSLPAIIDGAASAAPTNLDRPNFLGHVDGRLDVTRDTDITAQLRLTVATDNPGSPNVLAGLVRYPPYTDAGSTLGFDQRFNRLTISAGATIDRLDYQNSRLTDGEISSNGDRNLTQYGGVGRLSYEVMPGLKPFAEVEGDSRVHDLPFDRNGYRRDSSGGYVRAGTSFEFSRLLIGEISIGYAGRNYVDSRLSQLTGFLVASSLVWTATPLTTARFISDTQIAETTLPGSSGALVHTYTFEVDHDFRRWLTGIAKFTLGTYDYLGAGRNDTSYSLETDIIYKLTRYLWLKGTVRQDMLNSNVPNASSRATVVMLGVRLQN